MKTIGIIGGMGPAATCDLYQKITDWTDAACDQDHIHIIIDSNTNIPDRTAAILHGGKDPVPELVKSAKLLESAGADFLIMPCNTAHYFKDKITEQVNIPLVSIIESTADALLKKGVKKAALLATDGTVQSGVYAKVFEKKGIDLVTPDEEGQKVIMSLIYDYVKKGIMDPKKLPTEETRAIVKKLQDDGCQAIILGCTELPLAFKALGMYDICTDATLELAKAAIRFAGAPLKENA